MLSTDAMKLADRAILICGAPRSGTTWLAKIIDSCPDVLYRHEPDEVVPVRPDLAAREQLAHWIKENSVRTATKRPFFRKTWLPGPLPVVHAGLASMLNFGDRLLGQKVKVPGMYDFRAGRRNDVRAAIKLVGWDGNYIAEAIPNSRSVFILRHPCGTINSAIKGREAGHLHTAVMPQEELNAFALAAFHGISVSSFHKLSTASKLAWQWLAFNEPAVQRASYLDNVKIIVYEKLCAMPVRIAHDIFDFLDLKWSGQTEQFLAHSTAARDNGYFNVNRVSIAAANRWKTAMPPQAQRDVMAVLERSSLAFYWDASFASEQRGPSTQSR